MGQFMSDLYQVDELQWLVRSDVLPIRYAWIDFKVNGPQNKLYFNKFSEEFLIEAHETLESLKNRLINWNDGKERLRIICAAHLPDEGYKMIQESTKIDRAILFCGNKVRANNLLRDFPKIRKACFGYGQVIKTVQAWMKETETSILFYDLQEIEAFNRHNANIRALTDANISLKESKEHFKKYFEKFLRKDDQYAFDAINTEYNKLRNNQESLLRASVNKDALLKFLRQELLTQDLIFNEVNFLLKSTKNPKKLAYLRYVISDIFTATKDFYRDNKRGEGTYLVVVQLNEEERRRVKEYNNKYIMFTHFIKASIIDAAETAIIAEDQVVFQISVPAKNANTGGCNGYLTIGKRVVFNLGNYLRVVSISQDGKRVKAALVHLPQGGPIEWSNKEKCLALNQRWLDSQQQKYEGQYYSLILHDQKTAAEYIASKLAAASKEKQVKQQATFKWSLTRQKWKIRAAKPVEDIESHLQALAQGSNFNKATTILTLCQLYWSRKLEAKFRATVKRLAPFKEGVLKQEVRSQLFTLYDQFLGTNIKKDREAILAELNKKEAALIRNPNYLANETYHLFAGIKIACLNELGLYEQQLGLIGKMLLVYSVCQGTTCAEFDRLNRLKIAVSARKNQALNLKQLKRKEKICTSQVPMDVLIKPTINQPLPINSSKLDFSLFN